MTSPAIFRLVTLLWLTACTAPSSGHGSGPDESSRSDDSSPTSPDDSSPSDDSSGLDDSSPLDDSSTTSGDVEWTLVDSTHGPVSYEWAVCYGNGDTPCESTDPELCCGVEVGIARSQAELTTFYADSLPGVDYVPKVDFSTHSVIWSYLRCCPSLSSWLAVDDVTRVGKSLELVMHVEHVKLAPALLGRPWVVVEVPIGDYDGVVHNLYE